MENCKRLLRITKTGNCGSHYITIPEAYVRNVSPIFIARFKFNSHFSSDVCSLSYIFFVLISFSQIYCFFSSFLLRLSMLSSPQK